MPPGIQTHNHPDGSMLEVSLPPEKISRHPRLGAEKKPRPPSDGPGLWKSGRKVDGVNDPAHDNTLS